MALTGAPDGPPALAPAPLASSMRRAWQSFRALAGVLRVSPDPRRYEQVVLGAASRFGGLRGELYRAAYHLAVRDLDAAEEVVEALLLKLGGFLRPVFPGGEECRGGVARVVRGDATDPGDLGPQLVAGDRECPGQKLPGIVKLVGLSPDHHVGFLKHISRPLRIRHQRVDERVQPALMLCEQFDEAIERRR